MKKCSCCGVEKSNDGFQVRKASKDGLTASCKICLQMRDAARYPHEKVKRSKLMKLYVSTKEGKEISQAAKHRWAVKNAVKKSASLLVNNRVRDGKLEKPDLCSVCGQKGRLHGHHDDYSLPLSVRWLCPQCHTNWHHKYGEGANAF